MMIKEKAMNRKEMVEKTECKHEWKYDGHIPYNYFNGKAIEVKKYVCTKCGRRSESRNGGKLRIKPKTVFDK